jgi:hypothetical protein
VFLEDCQRMRKVPSYAWIIVSLASIGGWIPLSANDRYSLNNHWELVGDFVYMRRSDIHKKKLVKDANKTQCPSQCPNFTVLGTKRLVHEFDFEPGYRVGLTWMPDARMGFEWNFLYIQPWHAEKKVHRNQSLSVPFSHTSYTRDFHGASEAIAKYNSHFWDLEWDYWCYMSPRRVDYFSISGLAGLRYFHWDEDFKLQMVNPPDKSNYNIHTHNRIFGVQFGLDLQWNPDHWISWEFFAKVGGMVDHSQQKTFLGDFNNTVTLRDFERQKREVGIFTDVAAEFALHCNSHLNFHFGYQMMFFSGLTLAPEQISYRTSKHAGERDYDHGNAIIHGMYAGVIFGF